MYLIIGKEVGSEGTPHLQGAGEMITRRKLPTLQKIIRRVHWEKMKGPIEKASAYCKKEGDYSEFGTMPSTTGSKVGFSEVRTALIGGETIRSLLDGDTTLCGLRYANIWLTYKEKSRSGKPKVVWFWGVSGAGKSRSAQEMAGEDTYWKDDTKWWDGYDGQKAVVLDDFRAHQMKFTYLLKLLDRYPMRVEVKGGYRQMTSQLIIITSITHPQNSYAKEEEPMRQLIRRIDEIVHVRDPRCGCGVISDDGCCVASAQMTTEMML
uniref:Replication-associated protein n=1 Tax=Motacilla cinerea Circoviridae sp. TaxID=2815002 RepID=A0A8A4XC38_9CIRC